MDREAPSMEVELPSADLLQSAYQAVRPRLKPEDVPSAWKREGVPGTCMNDLDFEAAPLATPILVESPVVRMDEDKPLLHKKAASRAQGQSAKQANPQKHNSARGKASARLNAGTAKLAAPPREQRHERVIQHRDRSTTYTLGGPRCSRTDGKHWQCKREALPEQKYCEKHLHRGLLRTRKRKVGDGQQDYEGDFLFRGWQKDKPKLELWPGLCDETPPAMDPSPISSHSAATEGALLPTMPLQHPTPASSTGPSTGPLGHLTGQWTPAQKQILKAAFSELGLDGQELFPGMWGSRPTAADPPRKEPAMPGALESPFNSSKPTVPPAAAPHILRVGQDQAILPSTVQIVAGRDGEVMVTIPTASLATVGISVNGDSLVSTWGPKVPIYLAVGGSSELVKLEAVSRDEEAVTFKGHASSGLSPPKARPAIIPWDGPASVADASDPRAAETDLDLGLSLVSPSFDSRKTTALPESRPDLEALPRDAGFGTRTAGLVGKPEPQDGWDLDGRYAPPDWRSNQTTGLGKASGPSLVKVEWPSPQSQRAPPLPTGFSIGVPHPGSNKRVWPKGDRDERGQADLFGGSFPGRNAPPGEGISAGVLAGMVASVILQTPRGACFEAGPQAEEMEGSTDERAVDLSRLPSASGGQVSQCGSRGGEAADSASSPLKESRKRRREDGFVDDTGFCDESLDLALRGPGLGGKNSRGVEQTDRDPLRAQPFLGLGRPGVGATAEDDRPGFRVWQDQASALRARRGLDGSLTLATGRNPIGRSGTPSPSSFSPWTAVLSMLLKHETAALDQRSRDESVAPPKSPWGGSPGGVLLGSPSLGSPEGRWGVAARDA